MELTRKTEAEIEDLKRQWKADGTWDIEDTEGFEAHKTELYIWRLEYELKCEREAHQKLKDGLRVVVAAVA